MDVWCGGCLVRWMSDVVNVLSLTWCDGCLCAFCVQSVQSRHLLVALSLCDPKTFSKCHKIHWATGGNLKLGWHDMTTGICERIIKSGYTSCLGPLGTFPKLFSLQNIEDFSQQWPLTSLHHIFSIFVMWWFWSNLTLSFAQTNIYKVLIKPNLSFALPSLFCPGFWGPAWGLGARGRHLQENIWRWYQVV